MIARSYCLILAIFFASIAQASADSDFWKISSVEVVIRQAEPALQDSSWMEAASRSFSEDFLADLDALSMDGPQKIPLITNGEIEPLAKRGSLSVLPTKAQFRNSVSGWQPQQFVIMDLAMVNPLHIRLASAELKVVATYGGSYRGHGKFLKNVTVLPSDVITRLGTDFEVWVEVRDFMNTGTVQGEPVAAVSFDVLYKAGNFLNKVEGSRAFFITGNGEISSD